MSGMREVLLTLGYSVRAQTPSPQTYRTPANLGATIPRATSANVEGAHVV